MIITPYYYKKAFGHTCTERQISITISMKGCI